MNRINILKSLSVFIVVLSLALNSYAQSSLDGMKYQAIIRDANGNVVGSQNVSLKFVIYRKGFPVTYEENHVAATNQLGLVNLEIGLGTKVTGDFKTIDWDLGTSAPFYILVQLDLNDGNGFQDIGESKLLAVPYAEYARFAKTAEDVDDADADPTNELQDLQLSGNDLTIQGLGSPTIINLAPYLDNTDAQVLSYDAGTDSLKLTSGGSVYLGMFALDGDLQAFMAKYKVDSASFQNQISANNTDISGIKSRLSNLSDSMAIAYDSLANYNTRINSNASSITTNSNDILGLKTTTDSLSSRIKADSLRLNKHITDDKDLDSTNEKISSIITSNDSLVIVEGGKTSKVDLSGFSSQPQGLDSVLNVGNDASKKDINNVGKLVVGGNTSEANGITVIDSAQSTSTTAYSNALKARSNGTATTGVTQSAVYGEISGTNGTNIGVDGTSIGKSSGKNTGVGGYARGSNVENNGVLGDVTDTNSTAGNRGVLGQVDGKGKWNEGVSGFSTGKSTTSNAGVYGDARNSTGTNTGVTGSAQTTTTGNNNGVKGFASYGFDNIGTSGNSSGSPTSRINYGVYGQADSGGTFKRGVVGVVAGAVDRNDAAVYGIANGVGQNIALYGRANNGSNSGDTNIALYADASKAAVNIAGWFKNGNVYVDDTLYLTNGAQANYVLTSDAKGKAEWKAVPSAPVNNDNDSANEKITSIAFDGTDLRIIEAKDTFKISMLGYVDTATFSTYKALVAQNLVDSMNVLRAEMAADTNRIFTLEQQVAGGAYLDSSSTNELQVLSISNDTIYLTNGGIAVLPNAAINNDNDSTNEYVDSLSFSGNKLYLSQANGGKIDSTSLSSLDQSSDINQLQGALNDTALALRADTTRLYNLEQQVANGAYKDSSSTNELQVLSISNDTIYLSNGGKVVLPATALNNDNDSTNELVDSIYLFNNNLIITEAGGSNLDTVDLSQFNSTTDTLNLIAVNDSNYLLVTTSNLRLYFNNVNYQTFSKGKIAFTNSGNSILLGDKAGDADNLTGQRQVAIGYGALFKSTGQDNQAIGYEALREMTLGNNNVAMGFWAGVELLSGSNNVLIGKHAGRLLDGGSNNTFIGTDAGNKAAQSTSGAVKIGYQAGSQDSTNNTLFIDNSGTNSPLIYGDFSADSLVYNGSVYIRDEFRIDQDSAQTGKVLTADASGVAKWKSLPTGAINNDNDSTNELLISIAFSGDSIHITDAGGTKSVDLASLNQSGTLTGLESRFVSDSSASSLSRQANTDSVTSLRTDLTSHLNSDFDLDSTNEIQAISISNDTIFLSNGGFVELPSNAINNDNDSTNEYIDSLRMAGTLLITSQSNGANLDTVDLAVLDQSTSVILNNDSININADSIAQVAADLNTALANDLDKDDENELIDSIYVNGSDLIVSEGLGGFIDTVALPSSPWTLSTDSVYVLNKRVGIGNDNPEYTLDVEGFAQAWHHISKGTGNGYTGFQVEDTAGTNAKVNFAMGPKSLYGNPALIGTRKDTTWTNPLIIVRGAPTLSFFIDSTGNVGIGTDNPDSTLTVNGGIKATYFTMTDGAGANKVLTSDANGKATWQIAAAGYTTKGIDSVLLAGSDAAGDSILNLGAVKIGSSTQNAMLGIQSTKNFALQIMNTTGSNSDKKGVFSEVNASGNGNNFGLYGAAIGSANNNYGVYGIVSGSSGTKYGVYGTASGGTSASNYAGYFKDGKVYIQNNLGIGITNPSEKLHVSGGIKSDSLLTTLARIDSFYVSGATAANQVLISDANGKATWQTPTSSIPSKIQDADANTKIQVEKFTNEDKIRFDMGGAEVFRFEKGGQIHVITGNKGTYLGSSAGNKITSGSNNTLIGYEAGANLISTSGNTFVGFNAGKVSSGTNNSTFGAYSGQSLSSGKQNLLSGFQAGSGLKTGSDNVMLGFNAGRINSTGEQNTFVGSGAGETNAGKGNVFVGFQAGQAETGNNKLYIENTSSIKPLIFGDFSTDSLYFNSSLTIRDNLFLPLGAASGKVLTSDGNGKATWQTASGDNLGNHTMTQNFETNGKYISNDGDSEGIFIDTDGKVAIGTNTIPSVSQMRLVGEIWADSMRIRNTNAANGNHTGMYNWMSGTGSGKKTAIVGTTSGGSGDGRGVVGVAQDAGVNIGVEGYAAGGTTNWAGYFGTGNVYIKDTLQIATGSPTAGMVLTALDSDGNATWKSNASTCPTSMVDVNGDYCIDKNERSAAIWFVADSICVDSGYTLATYGEWYGAATQQVASSIGVNDMEDADWEWTSNISQNNVMVVGNSTAGSPARRQRAFRDPENNVAVYRCVKKL